MQAQMYFLAFSGVQEGRSSTRLGVCMTTSLEGFISGMKRLSRFPLEFFGVAFADPPLLPGALGRIDASKIREAFWKGREEAVLNEHSVFKKVINRYAHKGKILYVVEAVLSHFRYRIFQDVFQKLPGKKFGSFCGPIGTVLGGEPEGNFIGDFRTWAKPYKGYLSFTSFYVENNILGRRKNLLPGS